MKKKKILFVITYLELGGAQKQLLSIMKSLPKDEFEVFLAAGEKGFLKKDFLSVGGVSVFLIPELVRTVNPLLDILAFFKLYFYMKKNNFDIMHTHSPKASILARLAAYLAGVKNIIYTVHGWPFHKYMNIFSYYLYLFLEKVFANITSKIIVVSKADLDIGIKNRIACANKFQLIYYGVDIDQFENIFSQRISMIPKENLIITVSALKKQKGLDYFLQAAQIISKKHADAKFLIIGDGPKRSAIELKINNFGLQDRVVLKGWVDDLTEFYLKTKLMVVSSLWEGLPVAIIEAVLSGVAVVATDTGGVRDIIKDNRSGVIVDRADINSLAKASLDVLDNFKAWQDKIAANRNSIVFSEWSSEKMINQLHGLYSSFS